MGLLDEARQMEKRSLLDEALAMESDTPGGANPKNEQIYAPKERGWLDYGVNVLSSAAEGMMAIPSMAIEATGDVLGYGAELLGASPSVVKDLQNPITPSRGYGKLRDVVTPPGEYAPPGKAETAAATFANYGAGASTGTGLAQQFAPAIQIAAQGGNRVARVVNYLTELAVKDPQAFLKHETVLNLAASGGGAAGGAAAPNEEVKPYYEAAGALTASLGAEGVRSVARLAKGMLGSETRAARKQFGGLGNIDTLESRANLERAAELEQKFPGMKMTTGEALGDPLLRKREEVLQSQYPEMARARLAQQGQSNAAVQGALKPEGPTFYEGMAAPNQKLSEAAATERAALAATEQDYAARIAQKQADAEAVAQATVAKAKETGALYRGGAEELGRLAEAEQKAIQTVIDRMPKTMDATVTGEKIRELLSLEGKELYEAVSGLYPKGTTNIETPPLVRALQDVQKKAGKMGTAPAELSKYVNFLIDEMGAQKQAVSGAEPLWGQTVDFTPVTSLDELRNVAEDVNKAIAKAQSEGGGGSEFGLLKLTKKALSEAMDRAALGGDETAKAIKAANAAMKDYADLGYRGGRVADRLLRKGQGGYLMGDATAANTIISSVDKLDGFLGSFATRQRRADAVAEVESFLAGDPAKLESLVKGGRQAEMLLSRLPDLKREVDIIRGGRTILANIEEQKKLIAKEGKEAVTSITAKGKETVSRLKGEATALKAEGEAAAAPIKGRLAGLEPPSATSVVDSAEMQALSAAAKAMVERDGSAALDIVLNTADPLKTVQALQRRAGSDPNAQEAIRDMVGKKLWDVFQVEQQVLRGGDKALPTIAGKSAAELLADPAFRQIAKHLKQDEVVGNFLAAVEIAKRRVAGFSVGSPTNENIASTAGAGLLSRLPGGGVVRATADIVGSLFSVIGQEGVEKILTKSITDRKVGMEIWGRYNRFKNARDGVAFLRQAGKILGIEYTDTDYKRVRDAANAKGE